jgi:hypothetical protein
MPVKEFQMRLGHGDESVKPSRDVKRVPKAKPPSVRSVFTAFKTTVGSAQLIREIPAFGTLSLWTEIAHFSVCSKRGTALFLDIWDNDHFDGFTDMQRCITDCRAWFSADGFTDWGSLETKTGNVNCFFRAPADGNYVCNAQLQSFPDAGLSVVECLIDSSSFGPLGFTGTIIQPHPCTLVSGFHQFRIRQQLGSFFFLSVTVFRVG